ncbi:type II toxin-antitoxin system PemK/MazF family toxin [Lichenifustis flavocetrariae]|uniref:Type II toxin-antitoxin system PemK/MazF family toxin n=1 Tax=Lichenifustis flavocetrariae TaxID=2949735 RepID=A0AA41Z188_9HYPH|nr:type II toxin-antitoxin system PemK/MazF family toxin [Lichenifustis flavocetrariae]MCW6510963.1 type II toxin-antitoxin system PemK/MazF family toxin [Lichenifustis flavocetrariae]
MPISFVPQRGQILMCDFDMAGVVPPEMRKKRRVVVISPRSHNRRHGAKPGRCIVAPFSASEPPMPTPAEGAFSSRSLSVFERADMGHMQRTRLRLSCAS